MTRIRQQGEIRVGYAPHAPYAFRLADDSVSGIGPAVARYVLLHTLGLRRIHWVRLPFDSLIPALEGQRVDLVAAGLFPTPARTARVAFSPPVYCAGTALLVLRHNPHGLHAYADLAHHLLLRLAVLSDADELSLAEQAGITQTHILIVPDVQTGVTALHYREASAFALTAPAALRAAAGDSAVAVAAPFTPPLAHGQPVRWCAAFAVRRADVTLRRAVDSAVAAFVGTPAHQRLAAEYGVEAAARPAVAPGPGRSGG